MSDTVPGKKTALDTVNEYYAAYDAKDYDAMMALMTDDIVWSQPPSEPWGGDHVGKDSVLAYFKDFATYCESGTVDPIEMLDSGDHLVVVGMWHSRSKKTGRTFETWLANVFTIRDGKIAAFRGNHDSATVLAAFQD